MQRTTQRRIKLLGLSVAGSLVKEILVPDVTLSVDKTKLIARLVLRQKGKIYWKGFPVLDSRTFGLHEGSRDVSSFVWVGVSRGVFYFRPIFLCFKQPQSPSFLVPRPGRLREAEMHLDCKTAVFFANALERSSNREDPVSKLECETGERR